MAPPLFTLPGFVEPLNYAPHPERTFQKYDRKTGKVRSVVIPAVGSGQQLFPCALYKADIEERAQIATTTLRELSMMRFMNEITDKPNWNVKVLDDAITDKWKEEAQKQDDFTESMAAYCIEELRWRVKEFERTGFVFVFNGDVVKSDVAVSDDLKARLQAAVEKLEAAASRDKDYHPNSDDKVWDLVHPSLFPLVYGTSRILRNEVIGVDDCLEKIGSGEVVPVPSEEDAKLRRKADKELFGRKFQWLPCDVRIIPGGGGSSIAACSISSYINNLHPQHQGDLYAVLEEVIAAAIPLWNETLLANEDGSRSNRITYEHVIYDPDPETLIELPARNDENVRASDDECDADEARYMYLDSEEGRDQMKKLKNQCLVYPEPDEFKPPKKSSSQPYDSLPFVERFSTNGIQVIVKLATIELTPEKPTYDGGVWHVEGQPNEHICATALYYYSCDNITESRLEFRQMSKAGSLSGEVIYEQNDLFFLYPIFGCSNEEAGVQEVGSVVCKEGRLLTFPNTLQHRVAPFELADKMKPGHRKILALFLVDPNMHIISTSSVPPQRVDWWKETVAMKESKVGELSKELQDNISSMMDFPLGMEQAKALRLELMEERKVFEVRHSKKFKSVKFSLCEH